ncbi:hypothetical protein C8Q70DRAFT_198246 [Cubamyces menziesii]|nr:hypothetical protein C8Q70DRAFT_198246 [Cubamyces menziesii]
MRLLDTETGQFHEIANPTDELYAILSHTWNPEGEQSYQDLRNIQVTYEAPSLLGLVLFFVGSLLLHLLPSSIPYSNETSSAPVSTLLVLYLVIPLSWARPLLESVGRSWSSSSVLTDPRLSEKIRGACAYARANGHRYIWIDSGCIDKSSSAELSEAINAMYNWYRRATVCYVYLSDVADAVKEEAEDDGEFHRSRWHTRGWTLQELLAPAAVVFLSKDWRYLGTKFTLARHLQHHLSIPSSVLTCQVAVDTCSVAQRLLWAARRRTTRVEDKAYCLMGLFNVNMPLLYGEGDRAFHRLQQAIWAHTADHTIFAWDLDLRMAGKDHTNSWKPLKRGSIWSRYDDASGSVNFCLSVRPHFATQPAAFHLGGALVSISTSQYKRRLGCFPLNQKIQAIPSSPGGPIHLPLIPFEAWLHSEGLDTLVDRFSGLYLVPLACELKNGGAGNLVAIVCSKADHIDSKTSTSSDSPIPLKGCYVDQRLRDGHPIEPSFRTVLLARDALERCRESIQSLGVLPNNYVDDADLPSTTLIIEPEDTSTDTKSMTLHLAQWSRSSLTAQGYEVAVLDPVKALPSVSKRHIYGYRFTRADLSIDVVLQCLDPISENNYILTWTNARVGLVRKGSEPHLDDLDGFFNLNVTEWYLMSDGDVNMPGVVSTQSDPTHPKLEYCFTCSFRQSSDQTLELGFDMAETQVDPMGNATALAVEASGGDSTGEGHSDREEGEGEDSASDGEDSASDGEDSASDGESGDNTDGCHSASEDEDNASGGEGSTPARAADTGTTAEAITT